MKTKKELLTGMIAAGALGALTALQPARAQPTLFRRAL